MARQPRDSDIDHPKEPDLAPFMNMVIILIPMLLLSVVFLEVAVINVTMPLGGSATTDEEPDEDEEESLDLTVTIASSGLYISAVGSQVSPIDGCPGDGATVCLTDNMTSNDVEQAIDEARRMIMDGDESGGEDRLGEALQSYRWREFYNLLSEFKSDFPDETTVRLTADSDIPFALTVRTMDVARYQLEDNSYDDDTEFWQADFLVETVEGEEQYANLFGDPAFAVHQ